MSNNYKCAYKVESEVDCISTDILNDFVTRFNKDYVTTEMYPLYTIETSKDILLEQLKKLKSNMAFSAGVAQFTNDGIMDARAIVKEMQELIFKNETS